MNLYTNIQPGQWGPKCGVIERAQKFKYLDWILTPYINEKASIQQMARKIKIESRLYQKTYKSKLLSNQVKFRHYNTIVKLESLYAAQTLPRKGLAGIEKKERKFLRKLRRPREVSANG